MRKFVFLFLFACQVAHAEPLADFEAVVSRCRAAFENRAATEVAYVERTQKWVKRVYSTATIAYDVRQTDSLVTPYSGFIEVMEVAAAKSAEDEQQANLLMVSLDETPLRFVRRIRFAYHGGQWDVVSGSTKIDMRRDGRYEEKPAFELTRDAVFKDVGPIRSCLTAQ